MQNRAPPRARVQVPGHVLFAELEPIPDSYADTVTKAGGFEFLAQLWRTSSSSSSFPPPLLQPSSAWTTSSAAGHLAVACAEPSQILALGLLGTNSEPGSQLLPPPDSQLQPATWQWLARNQLRAWTSCWFILLKEMYIPIHRSSLSHNGTGFSAKRSHLSSTERWDRFRFHEGGVRRHEDCWSVGGASRRSSKSLPYFFLSTAFSSVLRFSYAEATSLILALDQLPEGAKVL